MLEALARLRNGSPESARDLYRALARKRRFIVDFATMQTHRPNPQAEAASSLDTDAKRMQALHEQGRYQESLDICLKVMHAQPQVLAAWIDAAVNCVKLGRWQEAIDYGQTALARGGSSLPLLDALAHAYGQLKQWGTARHYGLQALQMRDLRFNATPILPAPDPGAMPPPPAKPTRAHNVIAFSLFGRDPKYCEPAVINVQEQPRLYPNWVCRFYIDHSVPENIIGRLRSAGAQIVTVEGAVLQWPGPMWRLLAFDDPQAHRVLQRDADAVISKREATAVQQWIESGKHFHMMRDAVSHTELMMAGMWGAVRGVLPPIHQLMGHFLRAPVVSKRYADQYFLRQYVWPYARTSLLQHDSIFGFKNAMAFPDGPRRDEFSVGCAECSGAFMAKINLPDGAQVNWGLFHNRQQSNGQTKEELVCSYTTHIQDGALKAQIPDRYMKWIREGKARIVRLADSAIKRI
jgi:hypothetical protein